MLSVAESSPWLKNSPPGNLNSVQVDDILVNDGGKREQFTSLNAGTYRP